MVLPTQIKPSIVKEQLPPVMLQSAFRKHTGTTGSHIAPSSLRKYWTFCSWQW